jgi:hypothetical protein
MTEQKIQKQISDALKGQGWFVTKLIKTTTNGVPDVLACKNEQCMFIEVKKPGGKLSKLQEFTHRQMRGKGLTVFVAYGVEDVEVIMKLKGIKL